MTKLFLEEQVVLDELLNEWYEAMKDVQERAAGVFSEKGKMYDRESPVWERIRFPHGFTQEIRKKADRVNQLLATYDPEDFDSVNWSFDDGVLEEIVDISNFALMFAGLVVMKARREASGGTHG